MSKPIEMLGRLGPIPPTARSLSIDILRGLALFGILLVNMLDFAGPTLRAVPMTVWESPVDQIAEWFVRVFAEGAFAPIFACLLGVGIAIQLRTKENRRPMLFRRYAWLVPIGLVHALCLWRGDILLVYAFAALALLAFALRTSRFLFRFVTVLFLVLTTFFLFLVLSVGDPVGANYTVVLELVQLYSSGTYFDLLSARFPELMEGLIFLPVVFGWIIFGLLLGRFGFLEVPVLHLPRLRQLVLILLPAAILFKALYGFLLLDWTVGLGLFFTYGFAGPLLGASYMFVFMLVVASPGAEDRFVPLAAVGRMALSNYLAQTLIAVTIFHGYGLGFYGKIGPALGLLITLVIFALQIVISIWWLRRFYFGPVEWLWRSLSYRRPQPFFKG